MRERSALGGSTLKMSLICLPQDMLQHEINRFLDSESRAEFNAVLKPDERVYKKLAPNYALKHVIKMTLNSYIRISQNVNFYIGEIYGGDFRRQSAAQGAERTLINFFKLWSQPLNTLAIMYQQDFKENLIRFLETWANDDRYNHLYNTLYGGGATLRLKAAETLEIVKKIPFHYHISIADMPF